MTIKRTLALALAAAVIVVAAAAGAFVALRGDPKPHPLWAHGKAGYVPKGIHKIRHVVMILQENRSFDEYFGTFPGANGIPMRNGKPTVCIPNPKTQGCNRPFHDTRDRNVGGLHSNITAKQDINGGKMDGFISAAEHESIQGCNVHVHFKCVIDPNRPDVMGYHTGKDIPNYWTYARRYVMQDHMFEPGYGASLPEHLFAVSGWSAHCDSTDPMSCVSDQSVLKSIDPENDSNTPDYAWTDVTYLLHREGVSWRYYVSPGTQPDCDDGTAFCKSEPQHVGTPELWNPLPDFVTVHQNHQTDNVQSTDRYFKAARRGQARPRVVGRSQRTPQRASAAAKPG